MWPGLAADAEAAALGASAAAVLVSTGEPSAMLVTVLSPWLAFTEDSLWIAKTPADTTRMQEGSCKRDGGSCAGVVGSWA